jgi:hypothetical protein
MLPRYSTFQLPLDQQGLGALIIKDMLDTRLLTVWQKLLTSNVMWAKFERERITNLLEEKRKVTVLRALKENPVKSAAWPTEWKPYLLAWKRIEGTIETSTNWPWSIEELSIGGKKGKDISVKNSVEFLRRKTIRPADANSNDNLQEKWLTIGTIENKKKDITWRFFHKALPLGYRLRHISLEENGNCTWCTDELQTPEHFLIDCRISQEIWKLAYSFLNTGQVELPPKTIEEVFNTANIRNKKGSQAVLWLHINIIYEIWCQYTKMKWGEEYHTLISILSTVKHRLNNEIKSLQFSLLRFPSKKKKKLYKFLQCIL